MKTDLFISAYNDRIRKYLEELIRVAARRTQTSLWGKKLSEMGDGAKDILIMRLRRQDLGHGLRGGHYGRLI